MSKSLADQLLNTGLVDKKQAEKVRKEKRKERKNRDNPGSDEAQQRLQRQRAEQVERDRQLNRQREEQERDRAVRAQVRQILVQSRQNVDGDIRFNFKDPRTGRIKHLYVSAAVQNQLARGQLAICTDDERFVVVPRVVSERVAERLPSAVVFLAEQHAGQAEEDDPYKDYPIPDDLMW